MASQLQFNTNENKVEVNNLPLIHKAIAKVESNDDPNARGKLGERGRMQVLPSTAERPGFGIEPARDYSDLELTRVGQQYFNAMHIIGDQEKLISGLQQVVPLELFQMELKIMYKRLIK